MRIVISQIVKMVDECVSLECLWDIFIFAGVQFY